MTGFIHPSADVEEGAVVGSNSKIWRHVHIMSGAKIGDNCVLGQGCFVASTAILGDGCRIQNNVSLYDGVLLDNDVFVGPSAVFTNVRRPRAAFPVGREGFLQTRVGKGVTIGANATIVCGITIGEGAFVAAGSVVVRDVPAFALVAGVPASLKEWVCACGDPLPPQLRCGKCGREYQHAESGLMLLS